MKKLFNAVCVALFTAYTSPCRADAIEAIPVAAKITKSDDSVTLTATQLLKAFNALERLERGTGAVLIYEADKQYDAQNCPQADWNKIAVTKKRTSRIVTWDSLKKADITREQLENARCIILLPR